MTSTWLPLNLFMQFVTGCTRAVDPTCMRRLKSLLELEMNSELFGVGLRVPFGVYWPRYVGILTDILRSHHRFVSLISPVVPLFATSHVRAIDLTPVRWSLTPRRSVKGLAPRRSVKGV